MLIFSFDVASKNMGVDVIEFNEHWRDDVRDLLREIEQCKVEQCKVEQYKVEQCKVEQCKTQSNLRDIVSLLKKINKFLDNILRIIWVNKVDVVPTKTYKQAKISDITRGLKAFLHDLDRMTARPDLILVETQMKHNDTTRLMSVQIEYHYAEILTSSAYALSFSTKSEAEVKHATDTRAKTKAIAPVISTTLNPVIAAEIKKEPRIAYVGGALKNTISLCREGLYAKFAVKYASSYSANKAHASYNFLRYLEVFDEITLSRLCRGATRVSKMDDVADAFMMCFAYLLREKLL